MKKISVEIKEEILEKVKEGKKVQELSEQYEIKASTIYNWISRSSESRDKSALEIGKLKRENKALMKLVGRLTHEQDLAKNKLVT